MADPVLNAKVIIDASAVGDFQTKIDSLAATIISLKDKQAELTSAVRESATEIRDAGGAANVGASYYENYKKETADLSETKVKLAQAERDLAAAQKEQMAIQGQATEATAAQGAMAETAASKWVAASAQAGGAILNQSTAVKAATQNYFMMGEALKLAQDQLAATKDQIAKVGVEVAASSGLLETYTANLYTLKTASQQAALAQEEMYSVMNDEVIKQQESADTFIAAQVKKQEALNATNEALMEEAAMGEGMVAGDADLVAAEEAAAAAIEAQAAATRQAVAARNAHTVALSKEKASIEATSEGSIKLATALLAEGKSAEDVISVLQNMGRSEGEIAIVSEKLGLALKKVVVVEDEVTVATEKAGGAMGYFAGRAAAMELGLGPLGFVLGRLGASVKGLGAVFEVVTPILVAGLVIDVVENAIKTWEKWSHAVEDAAKRGRELADTSAEETDQLRLQNAELDRAIDKLEGRPENGLSLAFEQLRVESDKLAKSLDSDIDKINELFTKDQIGWFQGIITNMARTNDLGNEYKGVLGEITKAIDAQHEAVRAVPKEAGIEGIEKAAQEHAQPVIDAYHNAGIQIQAELTKIQKTIDDTVKTQSGGPAALGRLTPEDARAEATEHWAARVQVLTDALHGLQDAEDREQLSAAQQSKTVEKDKDQAAHDAAEEAKRKADAIKSADAKALRAAEEQLDAMKAQHAMTKLEEADFWKQMADVADHGADYYAGAKDRMNKALSAAPAQAAAAQKKADEDAIKVAREGLDSQKSLHVMSLLDEEAYWLNKGLEAGHGAAYYAAILDLANKSEAAVLKEGMKQREEILRQDADNAIHDIEMKKKLADIQANIAKSSLSENLGLESKAQIAKATEDLAAKEHQAAIQELTDEKAIYEQEAARLPLIERTGDYYRRLQEKIHDIDDKITIENAESAAKIEENYHKALQKVEQDFLAVGTKIESGFIKVIDKMMTNANTKFGREMAQLWNSLLVEAANYYAKQLAMDAAAWAKKEIMAKVGTQTMIVVENGLASILSKLGLKELSDDLANLAKKQAAHIAAAAVLQTVDAGTGGGGAAAAMAAKTAQNVATIEGDAAVAAAAAFESVMVALPFPANVAAAPGVAAGVLSIMQGFAGAAAGSGGAGAASSGASIIAERGAVIEADNTHAILHAKETVLPAKLSTGLQHMISNNVQMPSLAAPAATNATPGGGASTNSSSTGSTTFNQENHFHRPGDMSENNIARLTMRGLKRGKIGR